MRRWFMAILFSLVPIAQAAAQAEWTNPDGSITGAFVLETMQSESPSVAAPVSSLNPVPVAVQNTNSFSLPSGSAGSPSATVYSFQGVPNMVPLATASDTVTAPANPQPTITVAAYAAGQDIGGLIAFAGAARVSAGSGLIQSVAMSWLNANPASLDIVFFSANPSNSTVTDHAALTIAAADLPKIIGIVHVTDCSALGATAPNLCQATQLTLPFVLPSGQTIYAALVLRAAVTPSTTSDLAATITVLQN